jgi:asparagine synthase (glutamine-hydrolysing)
MLDGVGGDQLFQVSDAYLADLFRRGRWMELRRQWRGRGGRGARNFWRWAVRPALPLALVRAISRARGAMEPPAHHFDRRPPFWFESAFLDAHGVLAREAEAVPALPRHDQVLAETHLYLRYAFFPRIIALLGDFALDEGVELRSPLLDDRVVRFAAARPWHERVDRRETKLLLRHAMRGLLPDPVLAPRPHRTGTTSHYFRRQITGPGAAFIERQLEAPLLARIGMVDAKRLRRAWEHVRQRDDESLGAALFFTVQAEAWLREHTDGSALPAPAAVPASAPPVVPHGGPAPGGKGAAA